MVTLFHADLGGTNVWITASINDEGDLQVSGSDFGETPRSLFGSSEYEYAFTVKAADVPRLEASLRAEKPGAGLLGLIEQRFGGNDRAYSLIKDWCDKHDVPTENSVYFIP